MPGRLLVHLICIAGWKRQKADMISAPALMLESCTFASAASAVRASAEFVTRRVRPPQADSDSASKRCVMLVPLTPQPYPGRRLLKLAER